MEETQYGNLTEFLIKHSLKSDGNKDNKLKPTNTRIGDKDSGIYGGSYYIPDEKYNPFLKLYYNAVFTNNKDEYLTETQIINNTIDLDNSNKEIINGPILIDLDFRYESGTESKQYTRDDIFDIVSLYIEELRHFIIFDKSTSFSVYIMEKPTVFDLGNVVKDGIHIIIGIQMNHILQQILRQRILKKIKDEIDIPIINDWENVIDSGITKGVVNWQLYGSKKPNNKPYLLTLFYDVSYDESDTTFMIKENNPEVFNLKNDLVKLSARNPNNPKFVINTSILEEYEELLNSNSKKGLSSISKSKKHKNIKLIMPENEEDENDEEQIKLEEITNIEILKKAINLIFKSLNSNEYYLKELHKYTQILPEKYYSPGSHLLNRQVAFALKHTDDRLFLSWVMLRSKAEDFDYTSIPSLYKEWKTYFNRKNNECVLTKKSILYWAKNDAFEEYQKIKMETVDYYVEITLSTPTDFDFATVLYQMFKDRYVCSSIIGGQWYVFKNHKWELDRGNTLRLAISREMYALYNNKINDCVEKALASSEIEERDLHKKRVEMLTNISSKLKKTSDKNNIMKEAMELFYDGSFIRKLDSNKNLLGFDNGVIDFKSKTFRNGEPDDYISKSTNISYIPDYKNECYKQIIEEIYEFMNQLFPIQSLNMYMWEHLASCLIGVNRNQTFNIYKGVGSNGKSMLTDLMTQTLGDYKGVVPLTLITDKRGPIGGTSSEIMQLKGIRYAVMQEPSKEMKINEGVMKEIVGGDPLQGRSLYCESEVFDPQFTLAVCTNVDFTILSNDDGTWRRIRRVPFLSKFVDNPSEYDKNDETNKYLFPRDRGLKEKFPKWTGVFASILVNKVFETDGVVNDCEIVLEESKNYRKCQDYVSSFIDEVIIITTSKKDTVKRRELLEHFKVWYGGNSTNKFMPSSNEIIEQMNKKVGKLIGSKWVKCLINYDDTKNNNNSQNDDDTCNDNDSDSEFKVAINPNILKNIKF